MARWLQLTRYMSADLRRQVACLHSFHGSELVCHGGYQSLHRIHPLYISTKYLSGSFTYSRTNSFQASHPSELEYRSTNLVRSIDQFDHRYQEGGTDMIKGKPNSTILPSPTSTCIDLATSSAVLLISGFTPDLINGVLSPKLVALLTSCKGGPSRE